MTQIPDKVYAIGLIRPYGEVSPIRDEDTGVGISPLSIEDAVGELWFRPSRREQRRGGA
jgi:hypothetical protein